jgi:hypothetical protein
LFCNSFLKKEKIMNHKLTIKKSDERAMTLVKALSAFYGADYKVDEVLVVETEHDQLGSMLETLFETPAAVQPLEIVKPDAPARSSGAKLADRVCDACGQTYSPKRKDQRFCFSAECKQSRGASFRAQARVAAATQRQQAEEVTDADPFVEQ